MSLFRIISIIHVHLLSAICYKAGLWCLSSVCFTPRRCIFSLPLQRNVILLVNQIVEQLYSCPSCWFPNHSSFSRTSILLPFFKFLFNWPVCQSYWRLCLVSERWTVEIYCSSSFYTPHVVAVTESTESKKWRFDKWMDGWIATITGCGNHIVLKCTMLVVMRVVYHDDVSYIYCSLFLYNDYIYLELLCPVSCGIVVNEFFPVFRVINYIFASLHVVIISCPDLHRVPSTGSPMFCLLLYLSTQFVACRSVLDTLIIQLILLWSPMPVLLFCECACLWSSSLLRVGIYGQWHNSTPFAPVLCRLNTVWNA